MIQDVLPQLPCLVSRHNCCACLILQFRAQPTPRAAPKLSLKMTTAQAQIKGRKPQPKLPRRTWGLRSCSSGVKQRLREQLPCSCLHPLPAKTRFFSIQVLCDRTEGHEIIATVRHLELRFCSRPSQKGTAPQPQKWVRFRGPKTGPQTAACKVCCELM